MAHVAFAHVSNGTAFVTVQVDDAPQSEVKDLAKAAFAGLGVEYDGLAFGAQANAYGNYFCYAQPYGEEEYVRPFDNTFSLGVASKTAGF